MSETLNDACCGNCLWYNGDMRDAIGFCDEKEDFVNRYNYCYRYSRDDCAEYLKGGADI